MAEEDSNIVVIDNGSGMVKAGLAGNETPSVVIPAIVGRPKNQAALLGVNQKSEYIGDEAMQKKGVLNLKYPIVTGIVESWEDMEKVWHHVFFNELRKNPAELEAVMLTEAPRNPKHNREKMLQIMFESFEVKKCSIQIQAVLSLYAAGRTTGLVCDSGDGVSHTVPVFEGFSIPHAVEKMEIAGRVLTDYFQKLLLNAGHSFTSSAEAEIVREMKQQLCYVAQDYEAEKAAAEGGAEKDAQFTLPDKKVINVPGAIRMQCPELLFKPELNGKSCASLPELAWKSVQGSDIDVRKDLCKNIILSGGTTMYEGLADRLKKEITELAPPNSDIRVIASADRKFAVWKGGSILASLTTFASNWVTDEDYSEHGAAIVHRKCA